MPGQPQLVILRSIVRSVAVFALAVVWFGTVHVLCAY